MTHEQRVIYRHLQVQLKICCQYYKEFGPNVDNELERVRILTKMKELINGNYSE